ADGVVEQHLAFMLPHELGGIARDLAIGNLDAGKDLDPRNDLGHCRTPISVSAIRAVCIDRARTRPAASGSLTSRSLTNRCTEPVPKTVPRLPILCLLALWFSAGYRPTQISNPTLIVAGLRDATPSVFHQRHF